MPQTRTYNGYEYTQQADGSWRRGAAVGGGGPIYSGVDPSVQQAEQRLDISRQAEGRAQQGERRAQVEFEQSQQDRTREQEETASAAQQADALARGKLLRFIGRASELAMDANDNGGWFETGTTGALMRNMPGTYAADDIAANASTLRANLAFDALQAMRDASKTGGALGQVSEIELQLLESAMGNVNPEGQTHESFMRNLELVRQAYLGKLAMVDPDQARRLGYSAQREREGWEAIIQQYGEQFGVSDYGDLRGRAQRGNAPPARGPMSGSNNRQGNNDVSRRAQDYLRQARGN